MPKPVYYARAYRRQLSFLRHDGRVGYLSSKVVEVDTFYSVGDSHANLKKAFDRAEQHELFKRGWSVTCVPVTRKRFEAELDEVFGKPANLKDAG